MNDFECIDLIASVARLNITESERKEFVEDMKKLLSSVEILKKVEIDNQILLDNIENEVINLRSDEMEDSLNQETLLKNSPRDKNGYFIVRR